MRILIVSNFYPPHFFGGYEVGCKDVVEALKHRGHDVAVLTSTYGAGRMQSDQVYRWLETDGSMKINASSPNLLRLIKKESKNRRAFDRVCRAFPADVVYVWNTTGISIAIALKAQRMKYPMCYYISDNWLTRWDDDAFYSLSNRRPRRFYRRAMWQPFASLLKASGVLASDELDLTHVQFASSYLKRAALEANRKVANANVIHWGVDVDKFAFNHERRTPARLLYVGQLTSLKGVSTAIEAVKLLVEKAGPGTVTLTIVGGPDYGNRIHQLVSALGLETHVRFTGLTPRDQLPGIYREHDILLFPSIWEEPFSIVLLEAMSCGLAVVGTNTGGSSEILRDGVNALIFPKSDAEACARQVRRLLENPDKFETIRRNGRRTVVRDFKLETMVDSIELALKMQVALPQGNVVSLGSDWA